MSPSSFEQGLRSRDVCRFVLATRSPYTGEGRGVDDGIDSFAYPFAKHWVDDGSLDAFHAQCCQSTVRLPSDPSDSKTLFDQLAADLGP